MIQLAFKDAEKDGNFFSKMIAEKTKGKFCHVELWISGPQNHALCYSSREPTGTGFEFIDLTVTGLWAIEPTPVQMDESLAYWFCEGSSGRPYDMTAILGIGLGIQQHWGTARFCSDEVFNVLQKVGGFQQGINPWDVIPSGSVSGRYSLYDLVTKPPMVPILSK